MEVAVRSTAAAAPSGVRAWLSHHRVRERLVGTLVVLVVAALTVLPITFVVANSFNVARPGQPAAFGLDGWYDALFGSARTFTALGYSLILAMRAPIAVAVAFLISWLLIRVQIPGRGFIEWALWVAFFLPVLPITLGWMLLLEPSTGLINVALKQLPIPFGPIDIRSIPGIMWVHLSVATVPVMTMLLTPAFRLLDASLEEVSRSAGAGNWQTLRRITLPLLLPASMTALLAGLIRSLEAFEVEQFLGTRVEIYVYATRIFDLIRYEPAQWTQAMALSTLVLGVLFILALLYQRFILSRQYATLTGRGVAMRPLLAGRWRYAASAALITYVLVGVVLPLGMLIVGSFMRLFGFFGLADPFTVDHWQRVLTSPAFVSALQNSLVLGLGTGLAGMLL